MKKFAVIVVVVAAMLCTCAVWAQGGYGGGGGGRGRGGGGGGYGGRQRMPGGGGPGGAGGAMTASPASAVMVPQSVNIDNLAQTLALTDDQKAWLKDILTKSEAAIQPLVQKATETAQALRTALLASAFDAANVVKLAKDAEDAEVAVINLRIRTWAQIRGENLALTADQVTKLQAAMMRPRGMGIGGMRRGAGPGPNADTAPPPVQE